MALTGGPPGSQAPEKSPRQQLLDALALQPPGNLHVLFYRYWLTQHKEGNTPERYAEQQPLSVEMKVTESPAEAAVLLSALAYVNTRRVLEGAARDVSTADMEQNARRMFQNLMETVFDPQAAGSRLAEEFALTQKLLEEQQALLRSVRMAAQSALGISDEPVSTPDMVQKALKMFQDRMKDAVKMSETLADRLKGTEELLENSKKRSHDLQEQIDKLEETIKDLETENDNLRGIKPVRDPRVPGPGIKD